MYKGYDLAISLKPNDSLKLVGESMFNDMKRSVAKQLNEFINHNGRIDASKLQDNWFPNINADIFISHSHKDLDNAYILAGWLKEQFDIVSFIDSCIWGNYADILKQIDKTHCYNKDRKTYDYDLRNITTSHVHMMLANALSMMVYNTECLFFLNTPNSISFKSTVVEKTSSPWIYHEMIASKYLRQSQPKRSINESLQFSNGDILAMDSKPPKFDYELPKEHLKSLSLENLIGLSKICERNNYNKYKFLDLLSDVTQHELNFQIQRAAV